MSRRGGGADGRRRGLPLFPFVLIALGVFLLLQTTGVLPWGAWSSIWRLWPVLIIVLGVNMALGKRVPWLAWLLIFLVLLASVGVFVFGYAVDAARSDVRGSLHEPLGRLEAVDVEIDFGAGELTLSSLPAGSNSLVEADFQGREADTSLRRSGSGEYAKLDISARDAYRFSVFDFGAAKWNVSLSPAPRMALTIYAGVSDMDVDLRDLRVSDLSIDTGASDVEIIMPEAAGHVEADRVDAGAASEHDGRHSPGRWREDRRRRGRRPAGRRQGPLSQDGRLLRVPGLQQAEVDGTAFLIELKINAGVSDVTVR